MESKSVSLFNSSSSKTILKPWRSKERAFKIWSPRLAFAESGIKRFGLCSARSSQIALAPALEITTSVSANKSFNWFWMYSNWTYPFKDFKESSIFPFPQRWMTWKSFNNSGRTERTALLTATEPRLPPIIKITGLSSVSPQNSSAADLLPSNSSWRIGEPVSTAFSFGRCSKVSGKLQHTFVADGIEILFASPGVISDSWMMVGTWRRFPAMTTGTETKPPLEKITSGFSSLINLFASRNPFRTRKGSVKFCTLK